MGAAGARVMVTGGAGLIGQRVVSALLECCAGISVADLRDAAAGGVTSPAVGCQPSHDLTSGTATERPGWAPAGTGAAAADRKAAL